MIRKYGHEPSSFETHFAVKLLVVLGMFALGGCGGGGGGSTTPEPPEPPAQPRLSVTPGTLNETLELGSGDGTATITLSNSGSSEMHFRLLTMWAGSR